MIGYGDLSGSNLLFNEIGQYSGATLSGPLPAGNYLLEVWQTVLGRSVSSHS